VRDRGGERTGAEQDLKESNFWTDHSLDLNFLSSGFIYTASTWIFPVLFAVTFHEAAHGYVAYLFGDDTAYRQGRMTLNPLNHVDPFGTVILPALLLIMRAPFLFGWAKPVPVAFHRLRDPKRDMVLVAAAGPGTNLLLAAISALLFHVLWILPGGAQLWLAQVLYNSIVLNLVLAVFNMVPLPPLDGGRVAVGLLPYPLARPLADIEPYGMLILIGVIFILPLLGNQLGIPLDIFGVVIGTPVRWLMPFFFYLAGLG
jgi:Zn-dependent protease